ncbi:hypothetical protein VHUM_04305 [Vanrija humicola]|uniref:Uncharacterized protein n=1 Tax=Vanrija humicola TaxID=5417 RepID=A0A7D8YZU9_VANHU|nr:hypothetical protein VHUM_04305 [Vanrija humicola]
MESRGESQSPPQPATQTQSHPTTSTSTKPTPTPTPTRPIPADIVRYIAAILHNTRQQRTLANLARTSTTAYSVAAPLLYRDLVVTHHGVGHLFDVAGHPPHLGIGTSFPSSSPDTSTHSSSPSPAQPPTATRETPTRLRTAPAAGTPPHGNHAQLTSSLSELSLGPPSLSDATATHINGTELEPDTPARGSRPHDRRIAALSHVRHLTIRSLPPDHVCAGLVRAAAARLDAAGDQNLEPDDQRHLDPALAGERRVLPIDTADVSLLFPRLRTVTLLPDAIDAVRTWTPYDYSRPRNPPLLEALAGSSRPSHLCFAFRLVPSTDWETHRDLTLSGQYQLVKRIALLTAQWPLESVTYHDLVFQVPPSIPHTTNIYDFAPHVVPHPYFPRRFRFPARADAVHIPGPEWTIRPWQMAIAIKNLLPSGHDVDAALTDTQWVFRNVGGHILTKEQRDDDDSTGVWFEEVESMSHASLVTGLKRDLPSRDGIDDDDVDKVFAKVVYERPGVCAACASGFRCDHEDES